MNVESLIHRFSDPLQLFEPDNTTVFDGPAGVINSELQHPHLFVPTQPLHDASPIRIGVVFSGGPASGGHDVLCGILMKLRDQDELIGFCGGPKGLLEGNTKQIKKSDVEYLAGTGGFDFLGTDRTKIATQVQFDQVLVQVQKHDLSALIIVGGDDSNTNALYLANALYGKCLVIGIPKTIDGDLRKVPYLPITFGFHTATQHYAKLVNQLTIDSNASGKYWHVIKLMGRDASHVTLEVCLQSRPNACVLSEEISDYGWGLQDVIDYFATVILERFDQGLPFGTIVFPEGILDVIPEFRALISGDVGPVNQLLETYGLVPIRPIDVQVDEHGNTNFSSIQTETIILDILKADVAKSLDSNGAVKFIEHFFGYTGRAEPPSTFDIYYSRLLGKTAYELILSQVTGVLAAVGYWDDSVRVSGIPLISLLSKDLKKDRYVIKKELVDIMGADFLSYQSNKVSWRNQSNEFVRRPDHDVPLILEIEIKQGKENI